jgi:hypothetical protein
VAFPYDPLANPWVDGEGLNAAKLLARITTNLNTLAAALPLARVQYTQTTGGQALTNGAFTVITAYNGTADVDTMGGTTFNATTGVWTCPANGTYEISGQVTATGATAVRLIAGIQKGGVTIYSAYQSGAPTTQATAVMPPKEFTFVAGDTITLVGNPNAAGCTTVVQNGNGSFIRIRRTS